MAKPTLLLIRITLASATVIVPPRPTMLLKVAPPTWAALPSAERTRSLKASSEMSIMSIGLLALPVEKFTTVDMSCAGAGPHAAVGHGVGGRAAELACRLAPPAELRDVLGVDDAAFHGRDRLAGRQRRGGGQAVGREQLDAAAPVPPADRVMRSAPPPVKIVSAAVRLWVPVIVVVADRAAQHVAGGRRARDGGRRCWPPRTAHRRSRTRRWA